MSFEKIYKPRILKGLYEEEHEFDVRTNKLLWEHDFSPIIYKNIDGTLMIRYKDLHTSLDALYFPLADCEDETICKVGEFIAKLYDTGGKRLTRKDFEEITAYAKKCAEEDKTYKAETTKSSRKKKSKRYEPVESVKVSDESLVDEASDIFHADGSVEIAGIFCDAKFRPHYIGKIDSDLDVLRDYGEDGSLVQEYHVRPVVYIDGKSGFTWMRFKYIFWDLTKTGLDKYPAKILAKAIIHMCVEYAASGKTLDLLDHANNYIVEATKKAKRVAEDKFKTAMLADSDDLKNKIYIELKRELFENVEKFWYEESIPYTCLGSSFISLADSYILPDTEKDKLDEFLKKIKFTKFACGKNSEEDIDKSKIRASEAYETYISKPVLEKETLEKLEKYLKAVPDTIVVGPDTIASTPDEKYPWSVPDEARAESKYGSFEDLKEVFGAKKPKDAFDELSGIIDTAASFMDAPAMEYGYGTPTNACWLSQLPIEKLATYLASTSNCDRCKFCHDPYNCADGANCEKGIKLWLEEDYKDDTEEE